MSVTLPTTPLPQSVSPKPLDFGGWQEPIAGGVSTRLNRLGSRWSIDVTLPRLKLEPDGRIWTSRLNQAIGDLVVFPWPQPGLVIGTPGSAVVDTSGQTGSSVKLKTMTPGYVIREGQFFNLNDAVLTFLYRARADATVGGDGKVTVPVWPMLRTSPGATIADGSAAVFAAPIIVGKIGGDQSSWTLERAGARGLQFTITEAR